MEQSKGWGMCEEVANKHKHLEGLGGFTLWAWGKCILEWENVPKPLLPISVQDGTWVIWKIRADTGVGRGREVGNVLQKVREDNL